MVSAFGEPDEGALEGMTVRVDEAGQRGTGQPKGLGRWRHVDHDLGPLTFVIGAQQDGRLPPAIDSGLGSPEQRGCWGHARAQSSIACSNCLSNGVTSAARWSFQAGGVSSM